MSALLELDFGAGFFKVLLSFLSFFLGHAFLDELGCAINQIFGILEAQTGDFADNFNDADLVGTEVGENEIKFGLLGSIATRIAGGSRTCHDNSCCSGGY